MNHNMMGHEVGSYHLGLNEIESTSPMMNFITISYLFIVFLDLSVSNFWIYLLGFLDLSVRILC